MMKRLIFGILVIIAFLAGLWIANTNFWPSFKKESQEEATLLLEQIRDVTKLVSVEGYISEVYDYKDYYGYDWGIFRKKALIRVKAKVSAGFDLEEIEIDADPSQRIVYIRGFPEATILSIDHDLDYYDLQEGTFNSFSREDLNKLNEKAKQYVRAVAEDGDLLKRADARGEELLATIRTMVQGLDWDLRVEKDAVSAWKD